MADALGISARLVPVADTPDCVVVDRIEPGATPPYCVHGRTTCLVCSEWCWLGSRTYAAVASGRYAPLCQQCADAHVPPGTVPAGRIEDHRRSDGPH